MDEEPRYTEEHFNLPLKKPRHARPGTIYEAVTSLLTQGEAFVPTWDSTDHFHFACPKCGYMADVLSVEFYPHYPKGKYALIFHLGCAKCGRTGTRKIYFKPTSFLAHRAFLDDKILVFGVEKEFYGLVKILKKGKAKLRVHGKISCPECGRKLHYRVTASGYVCKNWKCRNYWKRGHGSVFTFLDESVRNDGG